VQNLLSAKPVYAEVETMRQSEVPRRNDDLDAVPRDEEESYGGEDYAGTASDDDDMPCMPPPGLSAKGLGKWLKRQDNLNGWSRSVAGSDGGQPAVHPETDEVSSESSASADQQDVSGSDGEPEPALVPGTAIPAPAEP
jgi:hypothetical protein